MVFLQSTVLPRLGGQGRVLRGACKWSEDHCDLALGVCPQEASAREIGGHSHETRSCPVDSKGS